MFDQSDFELYSAWFSRCLVHNGKKELMDWTKPTVDALVSECKT